MALTVTEVLEATPIRRMIARRLGASHHEAIQVPLRRTVDVTAVVASASDSDGSKPNLMDAVIIATARALLAHPSFNAIIQDGRHALVKEVNIGLATDAPQGLTVPVLRDADTLSPAELRATRRSLVVQVLARKHTVASLTDGTFTISNLGVLGVDDFDPIINPPQVAILGVGRLRDVVVPDGDHGVRVAKHLGLSLCFDHRFHDGAAAARFLDTISASLEGDGLLSTAP